MNRAFILGFACVGVALPLVLQGCSSKSSPSESTGKADASAETADAGGGGTPDASAEDATSTVDGWVVNPGPLLPPDSEGGAGVVHAFPQ